MLGITFTIAGCAPCAQGLLTDTSVLAIALAPTLSEHQLAASEGPCPTLESHMLHLEPMEMADAASREAPLVLAGLPAMLALVSQLNRMPSTMGAINTSPNGPL